MEPIDGHNPFEWLQIDQDSTAGLDGGNYETILFEPLNLDISSVRLENPYAPAKSIEQNLRLPDLETFRFGPLKELESLDASVISSEPEHPATVEGDIWKIAFELGSAREDIKLYSWEGFQNPNHNEPRSAYLSEAGPRVFDAALALKARRQSQAVTSDRSLGHNVLIRCLPQLGLGRSSTLFKFDEAVETFHSRVPDGRALGCSAELSQSLFDFFGEYGNSVRRLEKFRNKVVARGSQLPARLALAIAVSTALEVVEEFLSRHAAKSESIIQLQQTFELPRRLLDLLHKVVNLTKRCTSSDELVSMIYTKAQEAERCMDIMGKIMREVFRLVSEPWLQSINRWIGLEQAIQSGITSWPAFVKAEDGSGALQDTESLGKPTYAKEYRPDCITEDDAGTIFEVGKAFRVLQSQHPDHPLCSLRSWNVEATTAHWDLTLQEVERITEKALIYEQSLKKAVQKYDEQSSHTSRAEASEMSKTDGAEASPWSNLEEQDRWISQSLVTLNAPPQQPSDALPDPLRETIREYFSNCLSGSDRPLHPALRPPLSVGLSMSLAPILYTQAHLVYTTTLRLLFLSHYLRHHLSILNSHFLLSHPPFLTRLTSALLSPGLASAERRKGTPRLGQTMGLQLGTRRTWPPASSELRLALMGILTEISASLPSSHPGGTPASKNRDLPGGLSFAIRQLSERDIEKCVEPNSLYALDFLRLQYTPPPPLDSVVTPTSLEKYDTIFKFLLRIVRVRWVVEQQLSSPLSSLPRIARNSARPSVSASQLRLRFKFEALHVVTTLCDYFLGVGTSKPWTEFETYIRDLELRLAHPNYLDRERSSGASVPGLRNAHDAMLERVLGSLFLKRRHAKVMDALERVLSTVLNFASVEKETGMEDNLDVKGLYTEFREFTRAFLEACRRVGEREGRKSREPGASLPEEEMLEMLLLRLCMNGHYNRIDE
ncbi:MAG: hypothetical protein M1820_009674 [Bogoriella megaspora]|nr:MAG: hypothetical protein M1820_009674 [Bogoriella megaspora]